MNMSMRKNILMLCLFLLLPAVWAVAQYGGGYDRDGMRMRVSGCLYGDAGYLTLFDDQGNTFAVGGPQRRQLERWVGHRVQVEGRTFFDPRNPRAMSANGEDVPTIRVFEVENVSRDRCDYGGGYDYDRDRDHGGINIHIP
jgi:hypothetical protein